MKKKNRIMLWILLCVAIALVCGSILIIIKPWKNFTTPQEKVEEKEISESYIKDALPTEELTEIIFWSGDTPISIGKREDLTKIQECLHSMKGERVEADGEDVPAGFVRIELVYQKQKVSLTMQSKRINVNGTIYKMEDANPLIDLCRSIAESNG